MFLFALAALCPFILIALASGMGGVMPWVALIYMTVFVFLLDRLVAVPAENADPDAEFPASDALLVVLGAQHVMLFALMIGLASGMGALGLIERLVLGITAGLVFGQISHPVAHELIHRNARWKRRLGQVIYASLLVGHHASAHLRVHHVHVGSDQDPNSAKRGRGFYRFALRASQGSFRAGWRAEAEMLTRAGRGIGAHPYVFYGAVSLSVLILAAMQAGLTGVLAAIAMGIFAQAQILLSDYVQHYGLRRKMLENGRLEPVGPQHSWNAPHWYSSALMINATRHSDHHMTPGRPYPALQLTKDMPTLPLPVPMMAVIALIPPLWRRMMDPRVARWA